MHTGVAGWYNVTSDCEHSSCSHMGAAQPKRVSSTFTATPASNNMALAPRLSTCCPVHNISWRRRRVSRRKPRLPVLDCRQQGGALLPSHRLLLLRRTGMLLVKQQTPKVKTIRLSLQGRHGDTLFDGRRTASLACVDVFDPQEAGPCAGPKPN